MVVLGLLAGLNAAAFLVRLAFVLRSGALASTTGFEEFSLYNIWKAAHGLPLYEWPLRDNFLLTSYNAGFYAVYGLWVRLCGADGAAVVPCARLLSVVWAAAGVVLQARILQRLTPPAPGRGAWIWGLSFLTWFGTTFTGWVTVSARPDLAGAACALGGLLLALPWPGPARREGGRLLAASLCFFAAWSFKQSIVWIFAGCLLLVVTERRGWRAFAALAGPFAALTAGMLLAGGPAYRFNLLDVPRIYTWHPEQSALLLVQAVGLNLFFWAMPAIAWMRAVRRDRTQPVEERRLAAVALFPIGLGIVQLALHGSGTNNVFEGFLVAALLGTVGWLRIWREASSRLWVATGVILAATMLPVPAAQLAAVARGRPETTVAGLAAGNLVKLTADQLARRAAFAAWMRTLPPPVLTQDPMLQLPWFANANRYPVFPEDFQFEADAWARGLLRGGPIGPRLRRRYFGCVLWGGAASRQGRFAGYGPAPLPPSLGRWLPNAYGVEEVMPHLYLRSEPPLSPP